MTGPGFGFGAPGQSRRHRRAGGGESPEPGYTAGFTMAQFAAHEEKRIYQRSGSSGGGEGLGQGTVRVALSGVTAGTVGARIRAEDGVTILQAEWSAGTIADGATFIDIAGVDARLGWFFIDLKGADGSWQTGTVKIGMGALFGFAGQSLTARLFGRQDGQTATYASLGITPDANSAVLASYNESNAYMPTVATMPWQTPADMANGTGPNSVGVGEFLNRMIALTGVNCGAIGHSQGGVSINTFHAGSANWTRLADTIARAGGAFEGFVWGQGHSESVYGCPPNAYGGALTKLFDQLVAANSLADFGRLVWTIPAYGSSTWGTPWQVNQVRRGAANWCAANSAAYVHMYDIAQVDAIHESQAGAATMGRHLCRALRPRYGASAGLGPAPVSATRSGTAISLTLSDVGQTTLSLVGTPANRLFVFPRGRVNRAGGAVGNNRFPVSAVAVADKTTLSITLADDPGDGHALDLWLYWGSGPSDGTLDNLYDDRTDGDGIATGRILQANFAAVHIAAPSPGGTVNAPPGGYVDNVSPYDLVETSTTYGATDGAGAFDQMMTGGRGLAAANKTPAFLPMTVEGWFTCPTIPAAIQVIAGGFGISAAGFVAITTAGKLQGNTGAANVIGETTLVPGKRYHFAWQVGSAGRSLYLTNITDGGAGVRDGYSSTATSMSPQTGRLGVRTHGGSFNLSGGAVDEIALFDGTRYSGASYTCPTAPFAGDEADLVALYRCDGNGQDAAAA
jgi:hypothetical protein